MIVDAFVRPARAKNPRATTAWLTNLTDPKVQAEFNVIKGSIAIHKAVADSPLAFYWRILLPAAQLGVISTAILIFT